MKKIEFQEKGDITVIIPHGEMTFFFLEQLDEMLKEKIKDNYYKFIYDMSDVKWIDSMGLGLIAMSVKIALLNDSRVCIVNAQENVTELLRLSSLTDLILTVSSMEDALQSFER